jgi:hypothetical protein
LVDDAATEIAARGAEEDVENPAARDTAAAAAAAGRGRQLWPEERLLLLLLRCRSPSFSSSSIRSLSVDTSAPVCASMTMAVKSMPCWRSWL